MPISRTRHLLTRALALVAWLYAVVLGACQPTDDASHHDTGLIRLALFDVQPKVVVPGSTLVLDGRSFVAAEWGRTQLWLSGTASSGAINLRLPARFVDYDRLEVDVDSNAVHDLGEFEGSATIEVLSAVDGAIHTSTPLDLQLSAREQLTPELDTLQDSGVIFVNEPIAVVGDGLLLGGNEGTTMARLEGCFAREGAEGCEPVAPTDVPVTVESPFSRKRGTFAFVPSIAGIVPGHFEGEVTLRNVHGDGAVTQGITVPCGYELVEATVFALSPDAASLGQYVTIHGGGFVADEAGYTLLRLVGSFMSDGGGRSVDVDVSLLPEVVSGQEARYVLNEDDAVGQGIDLRYETGTFSGTATPVVAFGPDEVSGVAAPVSFRIAPVKQVVYLNFLPSYVESLRHFGLRAMDAQLRERVREVVERDFATVNVEIRTEPPTDFAHFAQVDIAGPDPNGLGLLGYDNTPGKDTENLRLYDRIGGVNALTQADGYPGFGGVFIESLFGYSGHPGDYAEALNPEPVFDVLFDPFRPDVGGRPVSADDLSEDVPVLHSGDACPTGADRRLQVACGVWALGSMIGSTVSHELGHSLGLADPYGHRFHNIGDQPNRLMDADRPFPERAELGGAGPSRFCIDEYDYLRTILPGDEAPDTTPRPQCW